ncbi:MAG: hypothetical protein JXB07_14995 [Anaerolineae bacterium]|nr:hypothetical protein [Anaerolineae bacterium]
MIGNASDKPEQSRRPWWIILIIVFVLFLCIILAAFTEPGKRISNSLLNVTEELTQEPTTEATTAVTNATIPSLTDEPTEVIDPTDNPTDEPTKAPTDEPTEEPTQPITTEPPTVSTGNGTCFAACDPTQATCLPGLVCVPGSSSTGYICWSQAVCQEPTLEPTQEMVCHPGQWTGCGGMPPGIICAWDHVAQCLPNGTWGACVWDPGTCDPCRAAACGDGKCVRGCENAGNCPADCSGPAMACEPMGGSPEYACACNCPSGPHVIWCSDESTVPDTTGYCTAVCALECTPPTTGP